MSRILLKIGTLISHDAEGSIIKPCKADVLIEGNVISKIEENIEDGFWGQLAGSMEAIDAGTMTAVDHSHLNFGPEYHILLSHGKVPNDEEVKLLAQHGVTFSTTPNTELQMGHRLLALRPGLESHCSLGIDTRSWGVGSIPGQMRLLLQHAHTARAEKLAAEGHWSRDVGSLVEEVFNLGTLAGAKAIGMAGEVRQIKVGAKADLLIFSATSPPMLAAATEDPVAAIVLHSSERDLETVILDGVIRKSEGKLLPVSVAPRVGYGEGIGLEGKQFTWEDVAGEVLDSRVRINERSTGIDWKKTEESTIDVFYMDRSGMVE